MPIEFLRCFSLLCFLSKDLNEEAAKLDNLDPESVIKACIEFDWQAPPRPSKSQGTKRRRDEPQEPEAGPSGLNQGAGLADSAATYCDLASGVNVDGYDDLDAEETSAWHKSIHDWHTEAATFAASDTPLKENYLKMLPDRNKHQTLKEWRPMVSVTHSSSSSHST